MKNTINRSEIDATALSEEENRVLIQRLQKNDRKALGTLIEQNERLIRKVISQIIPQNSYLYEDAFQEASIGLWKAAIHFDESKNCCFSTFAYSIMKNAVYLFLRKRTNQSLYAQREKKSEETDSHQTSKVIVKSFEEKQNQSDGEYLDHCKIPSAVSLEEKVESTMIIKQFFAYAKELLKEDEYKVFCMRWNNEDNVVSFQDIGKEMGVTKQRVQQIEKAAREKLGKSKKVKMLFKK